MPPIRIWMLICFAVRLLHFVLTGNCSVGFEIGGIDECRGSRA